MPYYKKRNPNRHPEGNDSAQTAPSNDTAQMAEGSSSANANPSQPHQGHSRKHHKRKHNNNGHPASKSANNAEIGANPQAASESAESQSSATSAEAPRAPGSQHNNHRNHRNKRHNRHSNNTASKPSEENSVQNSAEAVKNPIVNPAVTGIETASGNKELTANEQRNEANTYNHDKRNKKHKKHNSHRSHQQRQESNDDRSSSNQELLSNTLPAGPESEPVSTANTEVAQAPAIETPAEFSGSPSEIEISENAVLPTDNATTEDTDSKVNSDNIESTDSEEDDSPSVEIVGIKFRGNGKTYYFDPMGSSFIPHTYAIVETARGLEFGEIVIANKFVSEKNIVPPLRPVIRVATKEDIQHNDDNKRYEDEAFKICNQKVELHGLDMKIIEAQYTFDNSKLLFYFTSAGRVDFRDLVKDLASVFKTRIELRQIGIRDEARLLGGLGACGRPLCCSSFLSDFVQVSIKMAKEQNLSLNSNKISGCCGRLMCCLRYEYETYEQEIALTPPVDSRVSTVDGIGTITEINPLAGLVKVKLDEKQDTAPKFYKRDDVRVI